MKIPDISYSITFNDSFNADKKSTIAEINILNKKKKIKLRKLKNYSDELNAIVKIVKNYMIGLSMNGGTVYISGKHHLNDIIIDSIEVQGLENIKIHLV